MKKLLTVSIAAYNAEKYLKNCLDSILGSKHLDQIEILIQDDGSKDGPRLLQKISWHCFFKQHH